MHWLVIVLGTLILSLSISNPIYRLLFLKITHFNLFFHTVLRVVIFIIGLMVIIAGLYIESI